MSTIPTEPNTAYDYLAEEERVASLDPAADVSLDPSELPPPTQRGTCQVCSVEIDQWEAFGMVYPRCCDVHLQSSYSESVLAAQDAQKERRRVKMREVIPDLYQELAKRFYREYPADAWQSISRWEPAEESLDRVWGLLVTGETGGFKSTMVCHHVSSVALRTGYGVAFLSIPEFETVQKLAWSGTDDEKIKARKQLQTARSARILILDDLGKESNSSVIECELNSLIKRRVERLLPTIVTMNASADAYEARLSAERAKPFMRLLTDYNRHIHVVAPVSTLEQDGPVPQIPTT